MLAVLLPAGCWTLLAWELSKVYERKVTTLLAASTLAGCLCWLLTETLSLNHSLTKGSLTWAWLLCLLVLSLVSFLRRGVSSRWQPTPMSRGDRLWCLAACALLAGTLVPALLSPPATVDSLTYHMPRVAFWIQQHSCHHYFTDDSKQILFPPFAEFCVLNTQLLLGGEGAVNLVQWLAAVGVAVGIQGLCLNLGGSRSAGWLAMIWTLSIPILVLQSSSTQNDLFLTLWIVNSLYFGWEWLSRGGRSNIGLAGASAGLALLTKGTAYVILAPFLVFLTLSLIRRRALDQLGLMVALILAINAPHYARNWNVSRSPIGSTSVKIQETRSQLLGPTHWLLGPLRQASLNYSLPVLNDRVTGSLATLHRVLGVDPDDPRITFPFTHFQTKGWLRHEDGIGNPLDLAIAFMAGLLALRSSSKPRATYAALLIASTMTFCVMLKWQPWGTRLQVPLLVLASPLSALWLVERPRAARLLVTGLKVAIAFFIMAFNENRPWIGASPGSARGQSIFRLSRAQAYCINCPPGTQKDYQSALEILKNEGASRVGIFSLYYPHLLFGLNPNPIEYRYLESEFSATPSDLPEIVAGRSESERVVFGGRTFQRIWASPQLSVFRLTTNPGEK